MWRIVSARSTPVLLALILIVGGPTLGRAQDGADVDGGMPTPEPREIEVPEGMPIPADLSIVVIREDLIPGQFRILDVRLDRPVEDEVLATIANMLRDDDERTYQRTYIVYYLPEMEPGAGGWATSHFDPELEVQVLEPRM